MQDKALEAAARALCINDGCHSDDIEILWQHYIDPAQAAIAAYLAQREAEGPTEAQIQAAMPHTGFAGDVMARQAVIDIHRAMTAARPRGD